MKKIVLCIVLGLLLHGCFIQDFNKQARLATYQQSSQTQDSSIKHTTAPHTTQSNQIPQTESKKHYSDNQIIANLLKQQQQWLKTPYVSGGISKNGADCSGFVMKVFDEGFNISLPRVTLTQMEQGQKISKSHLKAGDLVFFKTGRGATGYHVGIYLENGDFMHLSSKGGAKIANLSNSYWKPKFKKAVRYMK